MIRTYNKKAGTGAYRTLTQALAVFLSAFLYLWAAGPAVADTGNQSDMHAGNVYKYVFEDSDMDFHFGNLALGSAVNGGVEIGEAFYAAAKIIDGNAASWQSQWQALGDRIRARGENALKAGHRISARDHLLRAAYYYRISLVSMLPDDPRFLPQALLMRRLMKQGGALFSPALEFVEIPFEGTRLPGYFRPSDKGSGQTLIMVGGGETFAEDLVFYIARQANERGYHFLTVDLPGQGLMPLEGKVFRTDTWRPLQKVVDFALSRPEIDPTRLAVYGFSGGGLFVPQAAVHDKRIQAIAMNASVVDAPALFATMPAATAGEKDMAAWSSFHAGVVKSICWRYGVDSPRDLIRANQGNTFDPSAVNVPALVMVGEGEYQSQEVRRQVSLAMAGFTNPMKTLEVLPADQGAANHCTMENRSLVAQVLFDWLDKVFSIHTHGLL